MIPRAVLAGVTRPVAALLLVGVLSCAPSGGQPAPAARTSSAPPAAGQGAQAQPETPKMPAPLSPPVTVKVGIISTSADAAIYIANDKGYFRELGLEIDQISMEAGAQMAAPLSAGQLDVGAGGVSAGLFNAVLRGIPAKIVADKARWSKGYGYSGFAVRKDLADAGRVKDYADMKGLRIGIHQNLTIAEQLTEEAAKKGGLTSADYQLEALGTFPNIITALGNKSIDIGFVVEPARTSGVESGIFVRWKGGDEIMPDTQVTVLMYSPIFAEKQPEAAKRFMIAYIKAIRDFVEAFDLGKGKDEVISILVNNTSLKDPAVYAKIVPVGMNPDGYANAKSIAEQQDWYLAKGATSEKVDLSKVIDNQYVDYALTVLGKYKR